MTLTCYVVDDMPWGIRTICGYIQKTEGLTLIGTATNPLIALREIQEKRPNIVFTDINMPEMSGLVLADLVEEFAYVVIVSGESQTALKGIERKDYIFLSKIVSYTRFLEAIAKIRASPPK